MSAHAWSADGRPDRPVITAVAAIVNVGPTRADEMAYVKVGDPFVGVSSSAWKHRLARLGSHILILILI